MTRRLWILLAGLLPAVFCAAQPFPPNSPESRDKPFVLVIGVDGFRWDYADRYDAKNILALAEQGVRAKLLPSFPSTTFPNFYTLATGLRPSRHGLVGMHFYDPALNREFAYQTNAAEDVWYGGCSGSVWK